MCNRQLENSNSYEYLRAQNHMDFGPNVGNRALLPRSTQGYPNWYFRRGTCNHGIAAKISETLIDAKKRANFATPQEEAFMS